MHKNVKQTPGMSRLADRADTFCFKEAAQGKRFRFVVFETQTCSVRDVHHSSDKRGKGGRGEDDSPLREEGVDDSVSQRIDGQLGDPLEILSAADKTDE